MFIIFYFGLVTSEWYVLGQINIVFLSFIIGYHYEVCNEAEKKDFEKAIETIAVAFSSKYVFRPLNWSVFKFTHPMLFVGVAE